MSRTITTVQRVSSVAEPLGQSLAPRLVADVRLPCQRIGCRAGHHDLDSPLHVVVAMPVGAQAYQFAVEVNADAATHADDHSLAVEGFKALLKVLDDVLGDQLQPLLCADKGLQLRPFGLDLLLAALLPRPRSLPQTWGQCGDVHFR